MGNLDKNVIRVKEFDSLDLQRVQRETIELATTKTDELLEQYKKLESSHNGRYVNSDLMKMVFDVYAESPENRGKYNLAVTNSAACLTNELFTRTIQNSSNNRCVFVCGPYGAGKSYFIQSLFLGGYFPENTIVYEGSITPPAFGQKVELAMKNSSTPLIVLLNPTLELSMQNIQKRKEETGRGVIKSEVVEKFADLHSNILALFDYIRSKFPQSKEDAYPLPFQIYNKSRNVEVDDLSISYNLDDLQHGTREEISQKYDKIIRQINTQQSSGNSEICL